MNNKDNLKYPVKMYWQQVPPEEEKIKNVLPSGTYCEPGNVINASHVHAEGKPWLQKPRLKKKENKTSLPLETKMISKDINIKNEKSCEEIKASKSDTNPPRDIGSSCSQSSSCSLGDLRKEDKQRVAELIREMAKFSEEKENAIKELSNAKTNFKTKLKTLEVEKQKMIKEQDILKEKLLQYEILMTEIQDQQKPVKSNENYEKKSNSNNQNLLKEMPGNMKGKTKYSYIRQMDPATNDLGKQNEKKNIPIQLKSDDEFADIFLKQQDKFQQQQEILKLQIEQLQKLQETIIKQQRLREAMTVTDSCDNQEQQQETVLGSKEKCFDNQTKGKYSQKLQSYISKQSKTIVDDKILNVGNSNEFNKQNILEKSNCSVQILVPDSLIDDENKENTIVSVYSNSNIKDANMMQESSEKTKSDVCIQTDGHLIGTSATFLKSRGDVCVQTDDNLFAKGVPFSKSKGDIFIGTDDVNYKINHADVQRLQECEKNISKLEQSLISVSSNQVFGKSDVDTHTNSILNPCSLITSKIDRNKIGIGDLKTLKEKVTVDSNSDDDTGDEVDKEGRKYSSITSALQRKHFQPSSILELIDGLQPPSTSTSIDHHSFKKTSLRTPLSPNNRQVKPKVRNERNTKLQKVYGALNNKPTRGITKQKQERGGSFEDQEEQKMLADVFFVR